MKLKMQTGFMNDVFIRVNYFALYQLDKFLTTSLSSIYLEPLIAWFKNSKFFGTTEACECILKF